MIPLKLKKPSAGILVMLLFAVALLMISLSRCSRPRASVAAFVKPGGDTLCIAIELSPVAHDLGQDHGEGYYYDVVRAISSREHRPAVIVPVTYDEGLEGLDNGLYDVLIADIPSTVAQKRRYLFTEPINVDRQVLVQRRDDDGSLPYPTLFDLGGREVYLSHGSPFATRIRHLADEIGDTIYVIEDAEYGQEAMIMMTAAGEIPNAVVNERQARALSAEYPRLDYSLVLSLNQLQSWAINKSDTAMLDTLNRYIRDFKTSDEFRRISRAYGYDVR